MKITVTLPHDEVDFPGATAWSVVSLGDLYIFVGDLPVAVFARGQWIYVRRFDDGQIVDS